MYGFLLALLILDGLLLSVVVLLQSGKGGGLAAMGGASTATDSVIGGRQAATLLTKVTWVTGGLFLGLAVVLSVVSSRAENPESVLRGLQQNAPAAAAPQPVQIPGTQPAEAGGEAAGAGTQTPAAGGQEQAAPAQGGAGGR